MSIFNKSSSQSTYALEGEDGTQKAYKNIQGGRGACQRTYIHPCNFETLVKISFRLFKPECYMYLKRKTIKRKLLDKFWDMYSLSGEFTVSRLSAFFHHPTNLYTKMIWF